jgi:hypothetical protein
MLEGGSLINIMYLVGRYVGEGIRRCRAVAFHKPQTPHYYTDTNNQVLPLKKCISPMYSCFYN